jgi:hyperosmotically inducible periplasmic protein
MKKISMVVTLVIVFAATMLAQSNANSSSAPATTNQSQMQNSNAKGQSGSSTQSNGNLALPEARTRLGGTDATARVSREVLHELLMNPYYSVFDDLAYRVDGNTVTLMGAVTEPRTKDAALSSLKKIEGVDKVNDQVEVLPPSPMDNQIRRAVYRAVFGSDGLSRYAMGAVPPIHILVKNGHVTLVGVVDNEGDKNMAGIRAKGVPNVFSVENDLQVATNTNAEK